MPNFSPDLEKASEAEIRKWINEIDPRYASLASEELTRRKFDEFDKTTSFFSKVLGLFAIIQIVVAVMQFILSVQTSIESSWQKLVTIVIFFIAIVIVLNIFYKLLKK